MPDDAIDPDDARSRELAPQWLTSVVVWWDDDRRPRVLAGPGADPLPAGVEVVHWLTSQDPGGTTPSPEENARLLRDLLAWAERTSAAPGTAWRWWPAVGASGTDDHAEHGIVVAGMDRPGAAALGDELRQLAIYEATDGELRIVRCRDGALTDVTPRRWPADEPAPPGVVGAERVAAWRRTIDDALAAAGP
ncbi:MAG: DUF3293 domain-containing protein [Acidimicrobiales bacterium]|nr:DUF3293 domain-containing protein [Acidimicrobiales bacterium]